MVDVQPNMGDMPPLASLPPLQNPIIKDVASLLPIASQAQITGTSKDDSLFWVSPPKLDPAEKAQYKNLPLDTFPSPPSSDDDEIPVQIVGEKRLGTDLYYWVVDQNEVVHSHLAKRFKDSYVELVDEYDMRKDEGLVEEFDEESFRIHPKDRLPLTINIRGTESRPAPRRMTRLAPSRAVPRHARFVLDASEDEDDSSQTDYDSQGEDDTSEDDYKGKGKKVRRSSRRITWNLAIRKEGSYPGSSASSVKRTRVNPKRNAAKEIEDDDYAYLDEESLHVSDDEEPKSRAKLKRVRGRLSRPAYGNIRPVADLSDDDSDAEMAALHAHRSTCERCKQAPAHELLNKFYKRGKKKNTRKKSTADDSEDGADDEQTFLKLGGWVRCLKCCVAAHWGCLGRSQCDEIMKAARSREKEADEAGLKPRKRETLEAYDTTEFICAACMKGGICMYCHAAAIIPDPLSAGKVEDDERARTLQEAQPMSSNDPLATNANGARDVDKQKSTTPPPAIVVIHSTPREEGDSEIITDRVISDLKEVNHPNDSNSSSAGRQESLFRCDICKRPAHYAHLPQPSTGDTLTPAALARYYQLENEWKCSDCASYTFALDKILAWRPYPTNAVEPPRPAGEVPNIKEPLPREYLVKWVGRSFRRLQWVPHMWLVSTSASKLKSFLATGTKVHLLEVPPEQEMQSKDSLSAGGTAEEALFLINESLSRASSVPPPAEEENGPPPSLTDAERRIPPAWCTVDRVLDVRLFDPLGRKRARERTKTKTRGKRKATRLDSDESGDDSVEAEELLWAEAERIAAREAGEEPSEELLETIDQWEQRTGERLSGRHAELVIWAFLKWDDLVYSESTWDSPPGPSDPGYPAFRLAFQRFLESRNVLVPRMDRKGAKMFDERPKALFEQRQLALTSDPELGQHGRLMDFQLTGVNWLFRNWWRHQPSILADEMGLGKTVQVTVLVGHLAKSLKAFPVLVVVPNSTITNWLREFGQWAPKLRVVPYHGDSKSRDIVRNYELYHDSVSKANTNLKFHVLVTTYETLTGREFTSVFKSVPRWELLIVDEGQRLKSDSSLLFKRLNELNTIHRILMTGTPLNNNIRELFNLMNFLDPPRWNDLDALEKKYENLTEELLLELHEALKPYFLRRTKAEVLKLPPKNEVIVPVSMTAIQKEVYKSILSQNMDILGSLAQPSSRVNNAVKKSNLNNLLMQLRKCLQHPYLVSRELEPTGPDLTAQVVHQNLCDASAKLRLLRVMLPKLKAKGHRVLLFSQFVIALDVIEDFLVGEGHKFLRLDGNTKQAQRQKDMDAFNKPESDYFIYLLSTRAGGVGINLWSADTVIIFDPDFNPHQDLQAISRAHRYGQTKTVLVFKLMVKGAAEERIVQTGKKKLALDHLIVQKMDDNNVADDVQSILTFGAKAVFEGSEMNEINYSDGDIENLITRTEKEGDHVTEAASSSFGFAKLWVVEKDTMEEVTDDITTDAQDDGFWGDVLARAAAEKAKAKAAEVTGRGAKRKATVAQKYNYDEDSPVKPKGKKRKKSTDDSDIDYNISEINSDEDHSGPSMGSPVLSDVDMISQDHGGFIADALLSIQPSNSTKHASSKPRPTYKPALTAIENRKRPRDSEDSDDGERRCGLCHCTHGPGSCFMTQNPVNLVDYRLMLMKESNEPIAERRGAVQAIDTYLATRGLSHLIKGQPTDFISHGPARTLAQKKDKFKYFKHDNSIKRSLSPGTSISQKEVKQASFPTSPCVICGGPIHMAKVCPVVKLGPESIRKAITRLSQDTDNMHTVNILQALLERPV